MKKNYLSALIILFLIICMYSCKKEQPTENPVEDAKSWYLKSTANSNTSLKSTKNTIMPIKQDAQWSEAKLYALKDGSEVVGVPVLVKFSDGKNTDGSYLLLIHKDKGAFSSLIVFNQKNDYFRAEMTASQLQTEYEIAVRKQADHKRPNSSGKVMTLPAEETCIDWYWTTIVYDSDGNVISYSESYVYTICGGSSGGIPPVGPEFVPDFGIPISDGLSSATEQNLVVGIDSFKVADLTWKFHEGYTWSGQSKEHAVAKVKNGLRTWAALSHVENIRVGFWALGTAEIFSTRFTPDIIIGGTSVGTMAAKYRIRLTPTAYFGDYESDYLYSYANWDVNFVKSQ
ncbi:MAG: hypothetical protein WC622_15460 [Pedobacter sp.]|jgi:hypothetical protein|uniref:hypothetical protein n=1 Tax=Pedobacter sp. TaxID=1411316 RepID=UPI003562140A